MWWIIFAGFGGFMLGIVTAALLNAARDADEWVITGKYKDCEWFE